MRNVVGRIKLTEYSHNKSIVDPFTFTATPASTGYHAYKTTSWITAKVGEKVTGELETTESSLETDLNACAIRIKNKYFCNLITVGHISREISRHVHFFMETEDGRINEHAKSLTCRPSPIPSGGLEILIQLTFSCRQTDTLEIMNAFVNILYNWSYTGIVNPEENDEENADDEDFVIASSNSNECDDVTVLN